MVIWFTGLSGSGKSTIAKALAERLRAAGRRVELLDGDIIRGALPATGFSREARSRHVRTVGFLAERLEAHGVMVLAALISPYAEDRAHVASRCQRFVEVHVATPLAVCESRDVKGLYARARRGELEQFTGIDDPYEAPSDPAIRLATESCSVEAAVEALLALVGEEASA